MPKNSRKKKQTKEEEKKLHVEVVKQMLTLSTAGFGLAAALAWNGLIIEFGNIYVKKYIPEAGGKILSLTIYAVAITVLAVFVTLQLSKMLRRIEEEK